MNTIIFSTLAFFAIQASDPTFNRNDTTAAGNSYAPIIVKDSEPGTKSAQIKPYNLQESRFLSIKEFINHVLVTLDLDQYPQRQVTIITNDSIKNNRKGHSFDISWFSNN